MFNIKQKTKTAGLSLALAAAMTGGVMMGTSTSVQAVNIANDGIGEVLIFPYYTARAGWNTYVNLTNTSERTIVVKIRWHEGVNSRDARDFNIVMSPSDVWTGAVIASTDETTGEAIAKVITTDKSCTAPNLAIHDVDRGSKGINFTNLAFSGENNDGGSEALDRTMEGYFAVYVMGVAKEENNDSVDRPTREFPAGNVLTVSEAAEHIIPDPSGDVLKGDNKGMLNNEGVPRDCTLVTEEFIKLKNLKDNFFTQSSTFDYGMDGKGKGEFHEPNNVLKGRAVLIHAGNGIAMGYDPTVLANFYNPTTDESSKFYGLDSDHSLNIIRRPSSQDPSLDDVLPKFVDWFDDTPGLHGYTNNTAVRTAGRTASSSVAISSVKRVSASEAVSHYGIGEGFGRGVDVVSLLFNRVALLNDYNVSGLSETDWVVTLPTKRWYVDNQLFGGGNNEFAAIGGQTAPIAPFDRGSVNGRAFNADSNADSCFDVSMRIWDREEGEVTDPSKLDFSPKPPEGQANKFCYETNVISFGDGQDTFTHDITGTTEDISKVMSSHLTKSFKGLAGGYGWAQLGFGENHNQSLPVIGMRLETRKKEKNPGVSYGFANTHSYKRPHRDVISMNPNSNSLIVKESDAYLKGSSNGEKGADWEREAGRSDENR